MLEVVADIARSPRKRPEIEPDILTELLEMHAVREDEGLVRLWTAVFLEEDIERIVEMARRNFDYVVIDMPTTLVGWTETVLHAAHVYFTMIELDMRSAQNTLRFIRALKAEELPFEKLRYILNRAPGFTDLTGKSRVKRMGESLDIKIEVQLPDGGKQVMESCDQGLPLAETAKKAPLRKEIQKLAQSIHELNESVAAGA